MKLPDSASNITYKQANQMLTFNDKSMTYDENGNLTSVTNACGTTTYTWDARNRLVEINGFSSALTSTSTCEALTASFKYDAFGRRIEKTVNGRTIQYLYDGQDIVQEIVDGIATVNYFRTLSIDEPLAQIESSGIVRYYQQDALGSVIALNDENGALKTQYVYDPFGNVTLLGEPSDNPFQYTGRDNDGTGLYYYRARYYSPVIQRFMTEDPIGFKGGLNFYAYVQNNPVNWVDPNGKGPILFKICVALAAADAGYTIYELDKYAKEQEEISKKIDEIVKGCKTTEDLLKRWDEIEELRNQGIKAAQNITKARTWGYVSGGAIAIFCGISMLPGLP